MNPDQEKADPSRSSVLLIGGSEYPSSSLPPVPAAKENVARLKEAFTDHELWGLYSSRVRAECDLPRGEMLDLIARSYRESERGGLFVLYFVGHAHAHRGKLYLAPRDTGNISNPPGSMVAIDEVFDAVARQHKMADRKLLILDCCYAGGAVAAVPGEAVSAGDDGGWFVMAATSAKDTASADSGRDTTFFTGALLKSFEGAAENRPSLSAQWVFETVGKLVGGSEAAGAPTLVPHRNSATWAQRPWLRNRLHVQPPPVPYEYRQDTPRIPDLRSSRPDCFRPWPVPDEDFVGHAEELELASGRFGQRVVLPVYGPRYAGKSAFVRRLLAMPEIQASPPEELPWLLLEITMINRSAECPVLEALAWWLEVTIHDVEQNSGTEGDPRRELVIDRLREYARGHTLCLVIDCGRLGYDSEQISGEIDRLLEHPYFRNSANIVISRVRVSLHEDEQLDLQIPIRLDELDLRETADLLTRLMARERLSVDGDDVMGRIQDRRLRLPGALNASVNGYISGADRTAAAPDPDAVATALLEGAIPKVAETLTEFGCRIASGAEPPDRPEPLAVLAVWALADRLPLPPQVLEDPSVGFPRRMLALLEDARILSRTDTADLILGQASEQALRSLVIAALTREESPASPLEEPVAKPEILDSLFPPELAPQDLDHRFSLAAKQLFTALGTVDTEDNADTVFQRRVRSVLGWIEDEGEGGDRLPRLHDVIRTLVWARSGEAPYGPTSAQALSQSSAEDERGTGVPAEDGGESLADLYRLYHAVASLTLAARSEGAAAETGARFVAAAEAFSVALAACASEQVPHTLLRSADASLAITGRRLGLAVRLLDVRLSAVSPVLRGARRRGPGQAGRITLAVSWLLNTADALIDADRLDEAAELADEAEGLVSGELPQDGTVRSLHTRLQLNSRIARVRSRAVLDAAQSRRALIQAVEHIVSGMELAHEQGEPLSLWCTRLFEAAVLLVQQSSTDDELLETRDLVLEALERCCGERRLWPPNVCVPAARFLRKVHVRCEDATVKQRGAEEAVELLEQLPAASSGNPVAAAGPASRPPLDPGADMASLNDQDTANVWGSLAQAYGFLAGALRENQRFGPARGRLLKAEEYAYSAVALAPSAFTYSVWLRQVLDLKRATPRAGTAGEEAEKNRRSCVRAVRSWLARKDVRSHAHALLDLTCLESDWAEEGSLRGAAQRPGEDFLRLWPDEQRRRIHDLYRERRQKLDAHSYRYGSSIELCALEARLEREHRRWTGVLDFKVAKSDKKRGSGPGPRTRFPQVDNSPVFAIFHRARELWPGEARLVAAEAAFNRYIWEYDKAVSLYGYLARTAPNGEIRRAARLYAAEAMLADVEYSTPEQRSDWHSRLMDAEEQLSAVLASDSRIGLALVLRERVAIRLNRPVDWEPIDAAFEAVVGGDYAGTVGRLLDRRHYGEDRGRDRLGERARITSKGESAEGDRLREMLIGYSGGDGDGSARRNPRESLPGDARGAPRDPGTAGALARDEDLGETTAELLGEVVLTDFTSAKLLNGLGNLYLDRATDMLDRHWKRNGARAEAGSDIAIEAADNARRAYDCFDACRILREARGPESIVTKFQRGRAITLAARYLGRADPFPRALLKGRGPQLRKATGLLLAAREHSVSGFNRVCSHWLRENNEVQAQLGLR
ncbi:caspase family protein [Streptomonospora sp. PA3]|uniref:caspase family protein n=1 Tax=Streptomonospora sp. PA3 TaxID=2607326 RepID=UPI0016427631